MHSYRRGDLPRQLLDHAATMAAQAGPASIAPRELERRAQSEADVAVDGYAAFALVHGLASIWLSGALPVPDDPSQVARQVTTRRANDLLTVREDG